MVVIGKDTLLDTAPVQTWRDDLAKWAAILGEFRLQDTYRVYGKLIHTRYGNVMGIYIGTQRKQDK